MRKSFAFVLVLSIIIDIFFISCYEEDRLNIFDNSINAQKKEVKQQRGKNHATIEYLNGENKGRPTSDESEYNIFVDINENQLVIEIKEELGNAQIIIKDKDGLIVFQENNITIREKKVITIDSANDFPYYLIITATDKEINGKIISYWVDDSDEE